MITRCLDRGPLPRRLADFQRAFATIRACDADFVVEEVPAYLPSGEGEHLFLKIEKSGLTTFDAVDALARALAVNPRDAGWAGLKDRHACTTQWLSFQGVDPSKLAEIEIPGLRILEHGLHGNKLRTGHLRANRFRLTLRDLDPAAVPALKAAVVSLAECGIPNYYGEQRFGREGRTLDQARSWLEGGARRIRPPKAKLLVSCMQSAVFNEVLARRLAEGSVDRALLGDLLCVEASGGVFRCDDPTEDSARVTRWEVSPTGPMVGSKMRQPEARAAELEAEVLAECGLDPAALPWSRRQGPGARRPLRVQVKELELRPCAVGAELCFTLPPGSYATVLLRELLLPATAESSSV